jgi:hypothetical protein
MKPSPGGASTYLTHRALGREEILKLDESCISNPKSRNIGLNSHYRRSNLLRRDFGFEMQDSSCAEHVQQLGSESLLPNLMEVKG